MIPGEEYILSKDALMRETMGDAVIDEANIGESIGEFIIGVLPKFVETVPQVVSDVPVVPLEETGVADPQVSFIEVYVPKVFVVVQSIRQANQAVLAKEGPLNSQVPNMTFAIDKEFFRIEPSSLDFDFTMKILLA